MSTELHEPQPPSLVFAAEQPASGKLDGLTDIENPLTDQQRVDRDSLQESRRRVDMAQASQYREQAKEYAELQAKHEELLREIRERLVHQFPEDPGSMYPEIVARWNLNSGDGEVNTRNNELYKEARENLLGNLDAQNRLQTSYAELQTIYINLAEQLEARWQQ